MARGSRGSRGGRGGPGGRGGATDASTATTESTASATVVDVDDVAHPTVASDELEMMRMKLAEAENAAHEAELVARGKVSKAFAQIEQYKSQLADAEAAADEDRVRADELAQKLTHVESALEETSERLQAAEIKVSVLSAQLDLSPTTSASDVDAKMRADVRMLNSALATANEKLKTIENDKEIAEANEKQLRKTVTVLNSELVQCKENIRALETANEDAVRTGTMLQKQAIESGERVAKDLRLKLNVALDELGELKRREAVRAATEHAAAEAVQRAEKYEFELKRIRNQLADAEMALSDSDSAVKALQFQLDIVGHDGGALDEASARRETRLRMELDEARANVSKSKDTCDRFENEVLHLRAELENSEQTVSALRGENNKLMMRADVAEKQMEINTLLGASANGANAIEDPVSSKLDVVVAENQRLSAECKAAVSSRITAEDTALSMKNELERAREEYDEWKHKARAMIDSKDREIDRLRSSDGSAVAPSARRVPLKVEHAATYVKTVVLQFLLTEEWQVQQSLLPTVVTVCGGNAEDLQRIVAIRAQLEPTIVHSAEVAFNATIQNSTAAVADSANVLTESLGLGRWF